MSESSATVGTMTPGLLATIASGAGFSVVESVTLAGREPNYAPVPSGLHQQLAPYLSSEFPHGLYSHQAGAIQSFLGGQDVVLSTSTASGKSLAFMSAGVDLLLRNPNSRVLALYPARALIQDQLAKWKEFVRGFGLQVGFIDGGVPIDSRGDITARCEIVLMTPDVAHAWLLAKCGERPNRAFLQALGLLILDEAHVYDGVFGTNMAFFLRRLEAVSGSHRLICSTATLGEPARFVATLTGREAVEFGPEADGSPAPEKTILRGISDGKDRFDAMAGLVRALADNGQGRFLAFADSRKMVELLVSASYRDGEGGELAEEAGGDEPDDAETRPGVLPYRAGYEAVDREAIQHALERGELVGVVTTSALELGLDIGDISTIVLLSYPPTVSAFWQRIGRAGRREPGVCLLIQDASGLYGSGDSVEELLARPVEPNWLYLDNRYIQFANALCAAQELSEAGIELADAPSLRSLPESFHSMLDNELHPSEPVAPDLYPLKQRGQGGPHFEFPVRSGIEQQFAVRGAFEKKLGTLTFSQALREAYPGAVYYYMGKAHRVRVFNLRTGQIEVRRERRLTTKPISRSMVFPRFDVGILHLRRSAESFLAECELQVSEQVLGFVEQRGSAKNPHVYEAGSPYYQRSLNRFFQTTGVCWCFEDASLNTQGVAEAVLAAFCISFGVQRRDLGVGRFHANTGPGGDGPCQGWCVYDGTHGSLRLTERLASNFDRVVSALERVFGESEDRPSGEIVRRLREATADLKVESVAPGPLGGASDDELVVIAKGEAAVYHSAEGTREVTVVGYRYTPKGLMYELEHDDGEASWRVTKDWIEPIHGQTRLVRWDPETDEVSEIDG